MGTQRPTLVIHRHRPHRPDAERRRGEQPGEERAHLGDRASDLHDRRVTGAGARVVEVKAQAPAPVAVPIQSAAQSAEANVLDTPG